MEKRRGLPQGSRQVIFPAARFACSDRTKAEAGSFGTGIDGTQRLKKRLHGLRRDRFCQVMVEAGFERAAPVLLLTPTGYRNEDDAATPRRRPDLRGQLVSIEIRKSDVQQQRMRTKGLG